MNALLNVVSFLYPHWKAIAKKSSILHTPLFIS